VRVLEEFQQKLEREAENAASPPPPLQSNQSMLTSSHQMSHGISVPDGRPAVGYTKTPDHSYSPYSQYVDRDSSYLHGMIFL